MCGIFGFADWSQDLPPVERLCQLTNLLRHRGPDGGGYWTERGIFLGHRRLSIIDLATGAQPMSTTDGRYVITFNGEVYNYPELRDELRACGATFRTASDTEVILAGYAQWGTAIVGRLEGMFAFAIYDRFERTVLLARDRFGEKPLLYAEQPGRLVFASEMSPLAGAGVAGRDIDVEALGGYLCLNYVPGTRTMLRGVSRVAPGEWRLYGREGLKERQQYWSVSAAVTPSRESSDADVVDELQSRLDRAVRLTLRSDVPVGLFLSGGVDSSVVAQSAARQGRLEEAFCVDFDEAGFSEWPRASRVASQLNLKLTRVPLDASVLGEFLEVTSHLDDPLADSSAMAVWTVARAAAARVKVVLSGDGGDELFGGYLTYPASRWHAHLRRWAPRLVWDALAAASGHVPVDDRIKVGTGYKLHRFLRAMPLPTSEAHFTWNGTWLPAAAAALLRGDTARGDAARAAALDALRRLASAHRLPDAPSLLQLQLADLCEYLPNDILSKVDRATMAHGLESRAPLLNAGVAELALSAPDRLRVQGSRTKVMLRRLCERHFGAEHAQAPKQGFSLPIHRWLRTGARPLVQSLLARDRVDALGVLDSTAVTRVVDEHLAGRSSHGWEIWGLMVLVAWHEQRVANPPTGATGVTDLVPVAVPAAVPVPTATHR